MRDLLMEFTFCILKDLFSFSLFLVVFCSFEHLSCNHGLRSNEIHSFFLNHELKSLKLQ